MGKSYYRVWEGWEGWGGFLFQGESPKENCCGQFVNPGVFLQVGIPFHWNDFTHPGDTTFRVTTVWVDGTKT